MSNRFALGLDIGGTKLAAGVVDLDTLQLVDSGFRATRSEQGASAVAADMIALARGLDFIEQIGSIGITFGGFAANNQIIKSLHVAGWDNFPLHQHLQQHFGNVPVYLANDANAVALSEWKFGAGRGSRAMLFVTVSTGVGGGLVLDGKLYEGMNGIAGEIGHVKAIADNGPACTCGRYGCVESISSGLSMVKYAHRLLEMPDTQSVLRHMPNFTARDINDSAHQGDELAIQVLRTGARYLGIAVGSTINLFDLDCVVIGGGVSRADNLWWESLRAAINETILPWRPEVSIKQSQLGTHEGIWGAIALLP